MKRYCDVCRHYRMRRLCFVPLVDSIMVTTEVERIAPEGDVIYPLSHYQLSYKDRFLYVMGTKFMDTDGRASVGNSSSFYHCGIYCYYWLVSGNLLWFDSHIPYGTVSNRVGRSYRCHT